MPTYEMRMNCEYCIHVEAENIGAAVEKAGKIDEKDWGKAWSGIEAELVEEDEGGDDAS